MQRQGSEGGSQAQGHEGHLEAEGGNEVLLRGFGGEWFRQYPDLGAPACKTKR